MSEVLFYHLTESKLEDALPPLLDKSLERGWRVVVQAGDAERRDALDTHLWTFREDSFLPHGTDEQGFPADQPVLLTTTPDNANAANVRFLIAGAEPPPLDAYERVIFMFDGYDQAEVERAREHWKRLKGEGHQLTYWQQNSDGRWVKKA
ncbi:DNA polymerase III subunit chi [Sinorhizobium sp. RAC02]|uniref:DNA polymerase III subunit chi n=1 Tax=Sinorhizobium sp. RAC02 TaxID=1842534 RepID=UPI00083D4EDD|nr:DNA polymerase III subunit chi [Sinorhizobium sp. RAC02]AOF92021.1 DNA polymerase III chi subunit, HolC family protein [Sinorhizobium sp. RAC02]